MSSSRPATRSTPSGVGTVEAADGARRVSIGFRGRTPEPLSKYLARLAEVNERLAQAKHAAMIEEEVISARMYYRTDV